MVVAGSVKAAPIQSAVARERRVTALLEAKDGHLNGSLIGRRDLPLPTCVAAATAPPGRILMPVATPSAANPHLSRQSSSSLNSTGTCLPAKAAPAATLARSFAPVFKAISARSRVTRRALLIFYAGTQMRMTLARVRSSTANSSTTSSMSCAPEHFRFFPQHVGLLRGPLTPYPRKPDGCFRWDRHCWVCSRHSGACVDAQRPQNG